MTIGAAVSLSGARDTLRNLALILAGLSSAAWTLALLVGGRICRRALRPVSEMADAARAIAGHQFDERLPAPDSGDELQDLGSAFNDLLDRLRESHERQRRFTGDASHQLRTPLTAMQGQVDLALRQERSGDEYRRVLSLVQRRTRHLRQIVEALLFLARPDAESRRPDLEVVDLAAWLPDHLASRLDGARSADIRLMADSGIPILVEAQPALLGELVDNLLDNAAKYGHPGSSIVVRLDVDGSSVSLSVEDRGPGLDPSEIPRLFEPFYRSDSARSRDAAGLGLGLPVAARLAGLFGGSIGVESTVGLGSTFTIRLPAAPPSESSRTTPDPPAA